MSDESGNATLEAGLPFLWITVCAGIVSFFDAFSIGANDVANSWATSVASKSISLRTAVCIACFTEFIGAVLLGAKVADTIRKGIIDPEYFQDEPYILMVVMFCANIGSCSWVMAATYFGLPVSTTHSVVGGVMGAGIAAFPQSVKWGWDGFAKIAASWFISPVLAGVIGAIIFLMIKFGVLRTADPWAKSKIAVPVFYFLGFLVVSFFIFYKGSPAIKSLDLTTGAVVGICVGIALVACIVGTVVTYKFVAPYIEKTPEINQVYGTAEGVHDKVPTEEPNASSQEAGTELENVNIEVKDEKEAPTTPAKKEETEEAASAEPVSPSKGNIFTRGLNEDVISARGYAVKVHEASDKFDGKAERMFSSLQILTASFASFAHGANDLANALAPFSVVVFIYENGYVPEEKKFAIPFWQIAYCAIGLDLGLFFLGYKLMKALGNQLAEHSPSRGFCMELGAMTTVLIASKAGIPVSTTHCITGATTGVALCNSGSAAKTFNWYKGAQIFLGWIITVPCAGLVSGLIAGAMLYSPINYEIPEST